MAPVVSRCTDRREQEVTMASLIARVTSTTARAPLARLLSSPLGLDVWEVKPDFVVLQADESQAGRLEAMGYGVEQLQMIEPYLSTFATAEALSGYHTVATLEQDLRRLAEEHPDIAELHEIGRSVEGRPLWALRIGERRGSARKVAFFGCHHAREWISVEVPYRLAEHLLGNSSSEPVRQWLQQGEVWVAPMVNPDGHEHTRTVDRLWRKNRRRNLGGSIGVDPNRNYGYMWGTLDISTSSHVPSDETYVGPRAFSEPEVRAVRDLFARELFDGVLSYHSYSQLILFPWGYTLEPVEDDVDRGEMRGLAEDMERLIRAVHGETYTAEQASQLYPTAGDTVDWAYGVYAVPSLTVELRPVSALDGGFMLPADQIEPCWEENRPAALEFIRHVFEKPER
jgi:carboxypeptidase T